MKAKLLSMLLLVTLLAALAGGVIPITAVNASSGGQQVWYITDTLILAASPSTGTGHTTLSPPQAFCTSLTATAAMTIPAGHWRGYIALNSAYTGSLTINVGHGSGENIEYLGSHDFPVAAYQTGFQNGFNFDIDAGSMSISGGDALYIRFNAASGTPDIATGGSRSYISSPPDSPAFPDPAQSTIYGLTMSVNGNGTTRPAASVTSYNYYQHTVVPVSAAANSGSNFSGWSGAITGKTNPTTLTMVSAQTLTANFASPVDLVLVTGTEPAVVGDIFDVVIQAQSGSQKVVGVDTYLDFDPTKLVVLDMNSATAGIQISDGAVLTGPIQNIVDNTAGHIDYSAGILGGTSYPSGTFSVATIRFRALAQTSPTTSVTFATSAPRKTYVSGDIEGTSVTGTLSGDTYTIASQIDLNISVSLQGANRPDSAWLVPLTVKFFTPGANVLTATPLKTFTLTSTKAGNTALIHCSDVQTGTYDISAVSSHTLVNVKKNVAIGTDTTGISLGTLLEGNATNDDRINSADFAILAGAYGKLATDPAYNALADFDGNNVVNIADFSLLSGNYTRISPIEVP